MVMDEFYGIRVESNNKPSYARHGKGGILYMQYWIQQDGGDSIKIENHDMSPLKTHFDTICSPSFLNQPANCPSNVCYQYIDGMNEYSNKVPLALQIKTSAFEIQSFWKSCSQFKCFPRDIKLGRKQQFPQSESRKMAAST